MAIDKKVKGNEEALAKLSASSVESIVTKESALSEQRKALEEKLKALDVKDVEIKKEKATIDVEMKKVPPFLASRILEIQELDAKIKKSQEDRAEQAKNLKGDLTKANLKEDFINKVLGIRGFGTGAGTGGKKGELEPHILAVLEKHPTGIKKSELVAAVESEYGHNKGAISRVLADESQYVAGGTLIQRGIVTKDGDKLVKA